MFRSFFYSKTNFYLADSSIEFYKHLEEKGYDLGMRWIGYLWLFSDEAFNKLKSSLSEMEKRGVKFRIYDKSHLKNMLGLEIKAGEKEEGKVLGLENIDVGLFVPKAGMIDVDKLVRFYENEFRKLNGEVKYGVQVESLVVEPKNKLGLPNEPYFWQESRVVGVKIKNKVLKAKKTIIAAGVWATKLLDPIGIDSHCKPKKRQIFVVKAEKDDLKRLFKIEGFNKYNSMPFTILPKPRVYVKPDVDEQTFWIGFADDFNRAFEFEEEPQPEENYYRYGIYPILTAYLPQFTDAHPFNAWAGYYAINTFDHQPVIFEINDLIVVGAASGSGIMKADSIGRIAAAIYFEEKEAELFTGRKFKVSDLGIENRYVEREKFVI